MSAIYWPQFCGDGAEYNAFWSENLTVNTGNPDLTRCFQNTVLTWIPCAFILVASLPYYLYLRSSTTKEGQSVSVLNIAKMILSTLLVSVHVVLLVSRIVETGENPVALYLSPALQITSYIVATVLIRLEFRKGFHTSAFLFFFVIFELLVAIVFCRSGFLQQDYGLYSLSDMEVWIPVVHTILVGMLFILIIPADQNARKSVHHSPHNIVEETTPLLTKEKKATVDESVVEETSQNKPAQSPEEYVSFVNKMLYCWVLKFVIKFNKTWIRFEDIYDIPKHAKISTNLSRFRQKWLPEAIPYMRAQKQGKQPELPSLFGAMVRSLWGPYVPAAIARSFGIGFQFCNPILLRWLLQHIQSDNPYLWRGVGIAFLMFLVSILQSLMQNTFRYYAWTIGLHMKTTLIAQVYRKALRLSVAAKRETSAGQVNNLISTDCSRFQEFPDQFNLLWVAPVQVVISVVLLWDSMDVAALGGLLLLVAILPFNGFFVARFMQKMQLSQMMEKDHRLKASTQILNGIKVLKLYAWEAAFLGKVDDVRERELGYLKKVAVVQSVNSTVWNMTGNLVGLVIYSVYILSSPTNILTPDAAFVTASLVNVLNRPLANLPNCISNVTQTYAAMQRIRKFLLLEEIPEDTASRDPTDDDAIQIQKGTFTWENYERPTLRSIDLNIKRGALVAVVGQVGEGKSSLLSAILGDMAKMEGTIKTGESISFVPQPPWIRNQTIRKNILMFKSYNSKRYKSVIYACALEHDLEIFPAGDMAEIGEKGINLSGGQKQRVSLARAVYQDKEIYLLDDPLSAVDSHVGKHLFDRIIGPSGILRNKTRVFVTHAISYLPQMDCIYVMKDGQITNRGTYKELINNNGAFAEFLKTYSRGNGDDVNGFGDNASSGPESIISSLKGSSHSGGSVRRRKRRRTENTMTSETSKLEMSGKHDQLIKEETSEIGSVKWNVIYYLMKSAGCVAPVCVILFQLVYLGFLVFGNIWLSQWTDENLSPNTTSPEQNRYRLGVYGAIIGFQVVTILTACVAIALGGLIISRTLHARLLDRLLHAPMSYFDTTPLGRILNRLSADMDSVDTAIPGTVRQWFFMFIPLMATIILLTYGTYLFLVICVPLAVFYVVVQKIYIRASRQLKRIDSVRRSPVYIHFQETLDGAQSIRAYNLSEPFTALGDRFVDESQRAMYMYLMVQWLLSIVLEFTAAGIVMCAALFAVLQKGTISVGVAGMMVSYTLQASTFLSFYVKSSSELENQMVAVERVKEYSEVATEAPWHIEQNKPPSGWPVDGAVEFVGYSTKYRPGLDLVLRDISCNIKPREKVGVVGRTGAGKSSLLLSLFRLIEPAGGSIKVDGTNTSNLGLYDLRSNLTIIPQDPVIFSGSLRSNLDPVSQYTDEELWSSLEYAHLKSFVLTLPQGLEHDCGENGDALSVGQRQLLCLARALLRKSRILVLDEATAAVDMETDALIQQTIRDAFSQSTIITIAHRINTILDYDRVMVMDSGTIVEFDSPTSLLENKSSLFYDLVKDAGLV